MTYISRNQPCPCGSGKKYRQCCGTIRAEKTIKSNHNDSFPSIFPINVNFDSTHASPALIPIVNALRRGNIPFAEALIKRLTVNEKIQPSVFNISGWIAAALGLPGWAAYYFSKAIEVAPNWNLPHKNLEQVLRSTSEQKQADRMVGHDSYLPENKNTNYLLIKSWGYGFWADVDHVLAQLLIAEITGRVPVVHWGKNSLFGDGSDSNAFEFFFKPVSNLSIDDLANESNIEIWPPKWTTTNLRAEDVYKFDGPFSRLSGLYLLGRTEQLLVADFHTGVFDILPWVPPHHHLYGSSVEDAYRYLLCRYITPTSTVMELVDRYCSENSRFRRFISVHMRGSDKADEQIELDAINSQYFPIIDKFLKDDTELGIFLMTDDMTCLKRMVTSYGEKVMYTNSQRTEGRTGVHYQPYKDGQRLGTEVLVDSFIAIRGEFFVGNGFSNPSFMVSNLKNWPKNRVTLLGENMHHTSNPFLHQW